MFIMTRKTKRYRKPAVQALFEKKLSSLTIGLFEQQTISIVTNETEREAEKAAMKALIERRSISLLE